jgi:hypothetical protein
LRRCYVRGIDVSLRPIDPIRPKAVAAWPRLLTTKAVRQNKAFEAVEPL